MAYAAHIPNSLLRTIAVMSLRCVFLLVICMSAGRALASLCPSDCDAFQLTDPPMPEATGSTSVSIGSILKNMVLFAATGEKPVSRNVELYYCNYDLVAGCY